VIVSLPFCNISEISGEGRYQCFASGPMMDGTGSHIDAMENMDESDPVNDLEDFRTELGYKVVGYTFCCVLYVFLCLHIFIYSLIFIRIITSIFIFRLKWNIISFLTTPLFISDYQTHVKSSS
jgi:hypothetical protein